MSTPAPLADPLAARIFAIERPKKSLLWLYLIRSFSGLVLQPFLFVPLFFKYETLRYRFDDKGISMSWGIFFRHEIFLTYARIQDIHVNRGIVERWLGLATIDVQTASGTAGAELSIVGLEEYEEIRDFLYSRMRGLREHKPEPHAAAAQAGQAGGGGEALELLRGIRDDLRALRAALEKRGGGEHV